MFRRLALTASVLLLVSTGCGSARKATKADTFGWVEDGDDYSPPGEGGFDVLWSKQLTDRTEARYLPVEFATPAFDPRRERVYIGTSDGNFFAFLVGGRRLWFYDAGAQIESQAAIDDRTGQIFLPVIDGSVHALDADGDLLWKAKLPGALRNQPVLSADAVYVVGENDMVTALGRRGRAAALDLRKRTERRDHHRRPFGTALSGRTPLCRLYRRSRRRDQSRGTEDCCGRSRRPPMCRFGPETFRGFSISTQPRCSVRVSSTSLPSRPASMRSTRRTARCNGATKASRASPGWRPRAECWSSPLRDEDC